MAGIAAGHAVTPHRVSHIKFDVPDKVLIQPPYSLIRMGPEIARGPDAVTSFVRYLQNVGWELEPYQANLSTKHEREESAAGNMLGSNGLMSLADSHVEVPFFAKPSDLNGSTAAWYDPNVPDSGDIFIQKRIADEDSFEQRLSADQSSYPSAEDESGENVVMDRVARGGAKPQPSAPDLQLYRSHEWRECSAQNQGPTLQRTSGIREEMERVGSIPTRLLRRWPLHPSRTCSIRRRGHR